LILAEFMTGELSELRRPLAPDASRPCWQCSHCASVLCPEPAADGLRLSGDHGHDCPICHTALTRAVLDDRDAIEVCERCKGILMPLSTFADTVNSRRHAASTPSVRPPHTDPKELDRRIQCPDCAAPMITDWYYGPGNIIVDTCEACGILWLDAGELRRAVDAPGPGRRG
jgi:Zn-finger nucleic acid-binding protein